MARWIFVCEIYDMEFNVIMKQSFLKRWQAGKWGEKQILKRRKQGEWCYTITQEIEKLSES